MRASLLACAIMFVCLDLFGQISDFNDADFKKADSIASLYPHHTLTDLKVLSQKLTEPLKREEEKFRAIYKWVCNNIVNDYSLFSEHKRQRELLDTKSFEVWNRKFSAKAFRILVNEHRTICTGYARLVSELAIYSGIDCRVVDGYGRSGASNNGGKGVVNHSWNAVKLNDKWYLCDPTWSSGVIDASTTQFVKKFNESYFLPSPEMFIQNHYPVDTAFMFSKQKHTLDEYLNKPLVYVLAYEYSIKPIAPESFRTTIHRGESITFRFEKDALVRIDHPRLRIGNTLKEEYVEVEQNDNSITFSSTHTFKSKGKFTVSTIIGEGPVISYEVTVR